MTTNYDIDYFIQKFRNIPPERWTVNTYEDNNQCCALGHCGERAGLREPLRTPESTALSNIFANVQEDVTEINDEPTYGPDPRTRILTSLRILKREGAQALDEHLRKLMHGDDEEYEAY